MKDHSENTGKLNITKSKEVPFKKEMLGVGHHRNKARIRTN